MLTSILFIDVGSRPGRDFAGRAGRGERAEPDGGSPGEPARPRGRLAAAAPGLVAAATLRRLSEGGLRRGVALDGLVCRVAGFVSVFFRPELLLLPTLRPGATAAYLELLKLLAAEGADLTPQRARTLAAGFKAKLDTAQQGTITSVADLVLTDQLESAGIAELATNQVPLLSSYTTLRDVPRWLLEVLWLTPRQLA